MVNKIYHSAMKNQIDNLIGFMSGTAGGGIATTLLSIDLSKVEGILYFVLSSGFAGMVGYIGKKTGELLWTKLTIKTKKSNETIHQVDADGKRDGSFE